MMDNLNEDYEKNAFVGEEIELAKGVVVRWISLDRKPWVQPVLVIQENTGIKDIEKNWWRIESYSQEVVWKIIGSNLQLKDLEIIYDLYLQYEKGIKPAELAKRLNFDFLAVVHTVIKKGDRKPNRSDLSYYAMKWIIDDLRMDWNETDFEKTLRIDYTDIKVGAYTFNLRSYPFESENIVSRFKTLRYGLKNGRVFKPKERPGSPIDIMEAYLFLKGSYEKTNKTIQKINMSYWLKHKKWINHRLETISEMTEKSSNKLILAMKERI